MAIAVPVRVDLLAPAPAAIAPTLARDVPPGTVACWQGFWGVIGSSYGGGVPFDTWDMPGVLLEPDDELDEVILRKRRRFDHLRATPKKRRS